MAKRNHSSNGHATAPSLAAADRLDRPLSQRRAGSADGATTVDDLPPAAVGAERYCIGCLARFPYDAGELFKLLSPADFVDERHKLIFTKAAEQFAAGDIDPVLLGRQCKEAGYLAELAADVATAAHIPGEASKIIEARQIRQLYILGRDAMEAALNGKPADTIKRGLLADLSDIEREREAKRRPVAFAYQDLKAMHRTLNPVVIDGIAREGETMNIVAPAKFGKSWLLHYIVLCIASNRYVFGRYRTTAGRVILIDNELHPATLVHRIQSVAEAMGICDDEFADNFAVWPLRGTLPSLIDLHPRILEIEPGTVKAIGYDAMYRFIPAGASENDNAAMKEIYNMLDAFAAHTRAVNIVVHHSSKGDQSGKAITDVGAGAGSQSRAADTHLVLRQHEEENVAVLESAIRSFAPIDPLPLRWSFPLWIPETGVDPSKLKGRGTKQDERQSDKDRTGCEATIAALADSPAGARALRRKTGFGEYRQERLLDMLVSQGSVVVEQKQKGTITYHEYRLT